MDRLALTAFENIIGQAPSYLTVILALVMVFVGVYVWIKKLNVSEYTSIGNIQSKQTKLLMDQIEQLSKDLQEARKDLRELFEQNLQLMKRITELEGLLAEHTDKTVPVRLDVDLNQDV